MILPSEGPPDARMPQQGPVYPGRFAHELLRPFSVLRTSDIDILRLAASSRFGASRVEILDSGGFEACASMVELPNIALVFGATDSKILIDHPEASYARLQIALKGAASTAAGRSCVDISERQACMTSAGHASQMHCEAGHERLTLRLDNQALARKIAAILGGQPRGRLEFEDALDMERPQSQMLLRMLLYTARELELNFAKLPPLVVAELEQSIIVAVLTANRHTFSSYFETPSSELAPWQIRRAEEYIEANAHRAVMLEELAAATGVGARNLYRIFRQARGYTPTAFAKLVRLRRARAMLTAADDPTTTVSGTAFKCGFANLGHFARDYRGAFGELPSDTLARKKLY
jgi:AraC-like DNA-binding protein